MTGVTLPASMSSLENEQVLRVLARDERAQLLAHERRQQERPQAHDRSRRATVRRSSPPTITSVPRGVRARRSWDSERLPADVEDHVVAPAAAGEVVAGVVDDVVGAERSDQVHLRRAAHAGDFGAERLGDLHGERPHASGRADDQDLVPGLDLSACRERPGGR